MTGAWPSRRDLLAAGLLGAAAAGFAAFLVQGGVRLLQEDGFYYLQVARNLAAGRGSSFDGLHPATGYQPLWAAVLVPVFALAADPDPVVVALQAALFAIATAEVFLLARLGGGPGPAAVAALAWAGLTHGLALSGLEYALHAALLLAVALALSRGGGAAPRADAALALLLALLVLTRLDALLLLPVLALAERAALRSPRRAALLLAPTAAALAAAACWYLQVDGQPLPVSSLVKRAWSEQLLQVDPRYASGGWLLAKAANVPWPLAEWRGWPGRSLAVGALLVPALLLAQGAGPRRRDPRLRALRVLAAYAALQLLAFGLAYHGPLSRARWYYVAPHVVTVLALAAALDALGRRWPRAGRAVLALCVAAVLLLLGRSAWRERGEEEARPLFRAAEWARRELPADARLGTWNAGAIGYLSGRQVVNLDGLMNSYTFWRTGRHDLCAYLSEAGITHVVDVFDRGAADPRPVQSYSRPDAERLARCLDRFEVLWTSGTPGDPGQAMAFRLRY